MSIGVFRIAVFLGIFFFGELTVSFGEQVELNRKDKFLIQELSILGQGVEPIERPNPVMRATTWKDTLRGWKNFLLEPEDTVEKERRRHLESLERLGALNDRRSFNALYQISYNEAHRYHPKTTLRAKEILFELIYLWNLDQLDKIEKAIERRIQELKSSSHYVMLNGRHDPGSLGLIEKEEDYREILFHAKENYDPTLQDGTDEMFYNYSMALQGAATVPRDIVGFFLFDTLLSNDPKNLIALPTRFVSGLIQAVYHGFTDIPSEVGGVLTAGHYGLAGHELGQKTANTVIVLIPTVKLAKQLAKYQIKLPEQNFEDPRTDSSLPFEFDPVPRPNGTNPYVPDLSPKPEWGNPNPFDNNIYRSQHPTQTPHGPLALKPGGLEVLPKPIVPDFLPKELWLDAPAVVPAPEGITFVIPPLQIDDDRLQTGDLLPSKKGKVKVIIIRKDNDGNILRYEEMEIDEHIVLQDLKVFANDEVIGLGVKNIQPKSTGPQAANGNGGFEGSGSGKTHIDKDEYYKIVDAALYGDERAQARLTKIIAEDESKNKDTASYHAAKAFILDLVQSKSNVDPSQIQTVINRLTKSLLKGPSSLRTYVLDALINFKTPEVVDALYTYIMSGADGFPTHAILVLGSMNTEESVKKLVQICKYSPFPVIKQGALTELRSLTDQRLMEQAETGLMFNMGLSEEVDMSIIRAIEDTLYVLNKKLKKTYPKQNDLDEMMFNIVVGRMRFSDEIQSQIIDTLKEHTDPEMRRLAAKALRRLRQDGINIYDAEQALINATISDSSDEVRSEASETLDEIKRD